MGYPFPNQSLKKEADQLKARLRNTEAITKAAKRKYYEETDKLSELQYQFKAANDIQQEASTLWRLRTLDGRALGPGEVPPVIPRALNGRAFVDHTIKRTEEELSKEEEAAKAKEALERKRRKAEKAKAREAKQDANEAVAKPPQNSQHGQHRKKTSTEENCRRRLHQHQYPPLTSPVAGISSGFDKNFNVSLEIRTLAGKSHVLSRHTP
ncbi:uncharacterized protein [Gossypium hirsutum]|uniref:Uncharacterized protein n=1 Tax=Gossypium hirsutum TaxID=3635 RepID=A0ABM3A1J7_GOSHI|nr:uncharacterized protein LOC121217295 [Gossypium hirsutum]